MDEGAGIVISLILMLATFTLAVIFVDQTLSEKDIDAAYSSCSSFGGLSEVNVDGTVTFNAVCEDGKVITIRKGN